MGAAIGVAPEEWFGRQDSDSRQLTLLEDYSLGRILGQGAFGVVYACTKIDTNKEYAVKFIDQVEMPVEDIRTEVDMLSRLNHPSIVRLHDVYFEKVFVCIILDLYSGGDMIEGMQRHWELKGAIPMTACKRATEMMLQSIAWLHKNNVVHRDVKGDNYMQDRTEIDDPNCRVFLSDFGTATDLPPFQRLKQHCGTKAYWAPEFYDRHYGLKVDVWAMGVVLFGMVKGRFPFMGEGEVKTKVLRCPCRFGERGGDFIRRTLDRNEPRRTSAQEALQHPWLQSVRVAVAAERLDPDFRGEVREAGANAGVKERRQILVERLRAAKRGSATPMLAEEVLKGFEVRSETEGCTTTFEWWTPEHVEAANFFDVTACEAVPPNDDSEVALLACEQSVEEMFDHHLIDATCFGRYQAKTFGEFVQEVHTGQARLMIDASRHKTLARVVDIVLLRVVHACEDPKYLVKTEEVFPDGRRRAELQLPGVKRLPHENGRQTVRRLVDERLPALSGHIKFSLHVRERFQQDEDSPSYPGVRTIYRKTIYEVTVDGVDSALLKTLGLADGEVGGFEHKDHKGYTRAYSWLTAKECLAANVRLKACSEVCEIDALVPPVVGYSEETLPEFMKSSGIDVCRFGSGGVKSLVEFSEELLRGESALVKQKDGTLSRVVDVVILLLTEPSGKTLVETKQMFDDGSSTELRRLPAVKRRSHEHPFWAAQRVLEEVVHINELMVQLDPNNVRCLEERRTSQAYGGLPTVYRRRMIPCAFSCET